MSPAEPTGAGLLSLPVPITAEHDTSRFECQHAMLATWLVKRALANAVSGASRSYVVCTAQRQVIGYYALCAGSVAAQAATGRLRRNMPDPLPVIVLGRLAVHSGWAGQGIGSGLLKDAVLRSVQASALIGARALLCHAIDPAAMAFYSKHGFVPSPSEPLTCMLGLQGAA